MNRTIVRLAAQALLGRRRGLVLLVLPVVLVLLTATIRTLAGAGTAYSGIVGGLGLELVVPLVALLAATAVLGPEIDDGSIVYLLAKPIDRRSIALSKFVVAWAATLVFGALPVLLAGLVLDVGDPTRAIGYLAAAAVASTAYTALFLALGALLRFAVVAGLLYVLFWEALLGGLLSGVRWVSVSAWSEQVLAAISSTDPLDPGTGLGYALLASALLTVGGVWFAARRLARFALAGET
ncbi:MAG: ABC transporter permease subunit [Nocardioides sp.]